MVGTEVGTTGHQSQVFRAARAKPGIETEGAARQVEGRSEPKAADQLLELRGAGVIPRRRPGIYGERCDGGQCQHRDQSETADGFIPSHCSLVPRSHALRGNACPGRSASRPRLGSPGCRLYAVAATQSVGAGIPTQSVGTRCERGARSSRHYLAVSVIRCNRFTSGAASCWCTPPGQVISTRSIRDRSPRPKWTVFDDCAR